MDLIVDHLWVSPRMQSVQGFGRKKAKTYVWVLPKGYDRVRKVEDWVEPSKGLNATQAFIALASSYVEL